MRGLGLGEKLVERQKVADQDSDKMPKVEERLYYGVAWRIHRMGSQSGRVVGMGQPCYACMEADPQRLAEAIKREKEYMRKTSEDLMAQNRLANVEMMRLLLAETTPWNGKSKGLQVKQNGNKSKRNENFKKENGRDENGNTPTCAKYGRPHYGVCRIGQNVCYNYGQATHFAKECPRKRGQVATIQEHLVPSVARVYDVTQQEAETSPNLIRGTISMDGHDFDALFDSGATHSFILGFIANGLNLPMYAFTPPMVVKTATRDLVSISLMCKEVKFSYKEKEYVVDLIVLEGGLVGVSKEPNSSIPIVCDFEDVFPKEIPQFPPERKIEFSIDLVPGVGLISLASYRMSPVELAELKKQIEDLSNKNFIRRSVSPWGTSIIFLKKKDETMRLCMDYRYHQIQVKAEDIPKTASDIDMSTIKLKDKLTTAPVLILPDPKKRFEIYCDASKYGLGCVLMQERKVVAYASRQLRPHEENYHTYDIELAAVVFTLKIWGHFLYGATFTVYIDHKSLKYLFYQKELNMRQRRWMKFLKDYEFDLQYHPGKVNVVADALRRKTTSVASMMIAEYELIEKFRDLRISVTPLETSYFMATVEVRNSLMERVKAIQVLDEGIQITKGKDFVFTDASNVKYYKDRLIVPNGPMVKIEHQKPSGLLQPLDILEWKWTSISMNFVVGLPRSQAGFDSIWSRKLSPQTDGQTERTIQTLEDMLRACVLEQGNAWDKYLPLVEFSYNNSYHASLGMAPYEACMVLRRDIYDDSHIVQPNDIEVKNDLKFVVGPSKVLARDEKRLRNRVIPMIKIQWEGLTPEDATWEQEDDILWRYPDFGIRWVLGGKDASLFEKSGSLKPWS
ncbi:uncharacterized protein LOC133292588 [Gastrolobium bilobum]|uniref:uncharacterized protein LOC133292588 n=1 Tax=Gastrolobium bilobum TaxID=150636 RepID=UPI002AB13928|nr:uncharacterized protein LOC133292588 [Gastrolobium bilobum]